MKIGDKIPEMLGVDANGKEVKASDYAGKRLAIYFYPKDNPAAPPRHAACATATTPSAAQDMR